VAQKPSVSPAAPSASGPHLTYVALGDSLLYALEDDCNSCTSAAVAYGAKASTALGMPVEVHNLTMHNGLKSTGLLDYLTHGARIGRAEEDVREAVASADIVSVTIGFNDSTMEDAKRLAAFSKEYETTLDGILAQIDTLRAGKPTVVRVTEIYNNGIGETPALDPDGPGTGVDVWKPVTEAQNKVICSVAKAHGALCVDIYHPFNGSDGLSSPAAAGYLGPDGVHPSQLGQDVIAAALAKAGYAPLR
jgi:lysophospholipase L1-like esterase